MNTDLITFDYRGQQVAFDPTVHMWNLTAMHQASGATQHKAPAQWLRGAQARELLAALAEEETMGNSHSFLETREGRAGGTWAHWQIAAAYAHYLNPRFYLQWNRWAMERVQQLQAPQPKMLPAERVVDSIAAMAELIREHFDIDTAWGGPGQSCLSMKQIIDELYTVGVLRDRPKYHMEHGNNRRRYYEEMAYEALQDMVSITEMRYRGTKRFYFGIWPKRWPRQA